MKNIYTSRTWMPPLAEYTGYLKKLWKSRYLTNNGIFVQQLEEKLKKYWKVKHVICVGNGTLATEIAIKALDLKEIYVNPFSYVSTVSVPLWMGLKVRFIDNDTPMRGPALVTHVYGLPNLIDVHPVIYDASHAFAVKVNGKSIMSYGDISIVSFHATKMFQTIEGGAIITNDDKIATKARWMRNFGHDGQYKYFGVGINCKMSEFHASMGLCMIPRIGKIVKRYAEIIRLYNEQLDYSWRDVSYYPIFYKSEKDVLKAIRVFEANHIFPRRYFYPALNTVFKGPSCPVGEDMASKVLCLPMYYELSRKEQMRIIAIAKLTL